MPFGLTNAPRIFQRAMDDILREQVGKTCHVYMDGIIIFSKTIEQHYKDLTVIINILLNVNMKISIEKFKFFQLETTFPKNIYIFKIPNSKKHSLAGSFLGLTGY